MRRSVAAGAVLAAFLGAVGCSEGEGPPVDTRAGIDQLKDLDTGAIGTFECSALAEYEGTYLGDNSKVTALFRAMPTGEDMETFEILGDEGVLVINYAPGVDTPDADLLDEALAVIADCGREYVTNLETVRFRVPEGEMAVHREF